MKWLKDKTMAIVSYFFCKVCFSESFEDVRYICRKNLTMPVFVVDIRYVCRVRLLVPVSLQISGSRRSFGVNRWRSNRSGKCPCLYPGTSTEPCMVTYHIQPLLKQSVGIWSYLCSCKYISLYSEAVRLYRPQTKLREGNVFTGICLFTGVPSDHYPCCIGPHSTYHLSPSPGHGYLLSPLLVTSGDHYPPSLPLSWTWVLIAPCYWHLVVITRDMFKLVYLRT